MEQVYFFAIFFTAILGFIVSGILVFVNNTDTFTSRLLAAFLFCFSFFAMHFALLTTDFFRLVPHLWKVFVWVSFLYMPISYVYVRSVLRQSFRFEKWDSLLLLPGLVYFASLIPFYLRPASEKLANMDLMRAHPELIPMEPESVFPNGTGFFLRILLGLGCVAGQYYHLVKWREKAGGSIGEFDQNRDIYRWLFRFTSITATFWIVVLLQFLLFDSLAGVANILLLGTIIGTVLFVCLYLLVRPSILYGIRGWLKAEESTPPGETRAPGNRGTSASLPGETLPLVEKKKSYLTRDQGMVIKEHLENHFRENKPYLKSGYVIAQLAQELKVPSYQLSGFINQEYGKNFNELINEYRVNHLVSQYVGGEATTQYTLEAIGREVGFNSRAAFIAAVRKVTGKTPSEILGRRMKESKEEVNH